MGRAHHQMKSSLSRVKRRDFLVPSASAFGAVKKDPVTVSKSLW